MRVTLPHTLGKEEVRRRMHKHADEIGSFFPAGLARVTTGWPSTRARGSLSRRAEVSTTPPGGLGTVSVMALLG